MRRITTPTQGPPRTVETQRPNHAHSTNPDLATVLFAAWSGDPAILVPSPPGAGKTSLITHLAHQLAGRAGLRVCIAAQTRAQAYDVAGRIADLDGHVHLLGGAKATRPAGLHPKVNYLPGAPRLRTATGVLVATTARWLWTETDAHGADILLVDEAYQLTHADLSALASLAPQIVMVGDPGQIDPVVTGDTTRWVTDPCGPHLPAPHALTTLYGDKITQHRLTRTWRCGPETTALIQPVFYPQLPFTSARPPIHLAHNNTPLPELVTHTITPTSEHDPLIAEAAAARVRELLTTTVHTPDTDRQLTEHDLAVVTPHRTQAGLISAHLADLPGLLISTANALQGAERVATVVVHPMCGHPEATDFNTDLGRTCVALSRHRAHATVITDATTPAVLARAMRESQAHTLTAQAQLLKGLTDRSRP